MKDKSFSFSINSQTSGAEFNEILEKLTEAAHLMVQCALHNGAVANAPDMQHLFQSAGGLNAALYFNTQIINGTMPTGPQQGGPIRVQ